MCLTSTDVDRAIHERDHPMTDCTCKYCYHNVCFHPQRGDEANLGVLCDGCQLDDLPPVITETEAAFAITLLQ